MAEQRDFGPLEVTVNADDLAEFVAAAKMVADAVEEIDPEFAFLSAFVIAGAERFTKDFNLPPMVMSYALRRAEDLK